MHSVNDTKPKWASSNNNSEINGSYHSDKQALTYITNLQYLYQNRKIFFFLFIKPIRFSSRPIYGRNPSWYNT